METMRNDELKGMETRAHMMRGTPLNVAKHSEAMFEEQQITSKYCFVRFPGVPGSPRVSSQKVQRRSETVGEGWRTYDKV